MSSVDFLADLGPSADTRAVARVLAAATAPPWPHELRGYEAARRAFENAGATPVRRSAAVPLRRLIGVKLAAVAGALTVTGVAVAAEADVLPSSIQRAAHQMLGGVGVPDPDPEPRAGQTMASSSQSSQMPGESSRSSTGQVAAPHGSQSPDQASGDPSSSDGLPGTPAGTADSSAPSTSASDAADALTLCREYATHKKGNGNGGLSEHDRRKLIALAGGADKIDAYCAQVLAAAPTPTVPQPTGAASTSQPAPSTSAAPSPSHDHKPAASTSPSSGGAAFGPASSSSSAAHAHVPDPTGHGR